MPLRIRLKEVSKRARPSTSLGNAHGKTPSALVSNCLQVVFIIGPLITVTDTLLPVPAKFVMSTGNVGKCYGTGLGKEAEVSRLHGGSTLSRNLLICRSFR